MPTYNETTKPQNELVHGRKTRREVNTASRVHYYKYREKRLKFERKRHARVRLKVLETYGKGRIECACCKETMILFLTLDHINNDGAAHRRKFSKEGKALSFRKLLSLGCPNDPPLQVLCMNCNFGKDMNGGVCPHVQFDFERWKMEGSNRISVTKKKCHPY